MYHTYLLFICLIINQIFEKTLTKMTHLCIFESDNQTLLNKPLKIIPSDQNKIYSLDNLSFKCLST